MTETWGWWCAAHRLWFADETALTAHINGILNQEHVVMGARKITGALPLP